MRNLLPCVILILFSFHLKSQVVYTNGEFVTGIGNGFSGANTSSLNTPYTIYGYGVNVTTGLICADNFTVPLEQKWLLTGVNLFSYQTGSTTSSTITDLRVQIWKGKPGQPGSTIVFGDFTTNRLAGNVFSNTYRVLTTTLTDNQRPIMKITANINTLLSPGEYWIGWSIGGSLASGPWAVPLNTGLTSNDAIQSTDAGLTWVTLVDGGFNMDFPFELTGDKIFDSKKYNNIPLANFAYDEGVDTIWVNSPYTFVNTSADDSVAYWNITQLNETRVCNTPGYGCYLSDKRNYRRIFTQTGEYTVKLVVGNKMGKDSIVKRVIVANQTRKPQAQFYFDKQTMGIGQQVQGYDYSHYGPTGWEWKISPGLDSNKFLPTKNDPTPLFFGREIGLFDVCLKVWNPIGADSLCRQGFMQVTSGNTMCGGDSVSRDLNGYIYSNRGPVDSYDPTTMNNCSYFINPCATSLDAYIEKFNLRKNDTILFRDGGPNGPVVRKLGGNSITNSQRFLSSATGRLYVQWQLGNNNPINGGDSGFVMKWTSVGATYNVPSVLFTCRDTIYSTQNIIYNNQSNGQGLLEYTWDADGDGTFGDFTTATGANWTFVTSQPMVRNICLKVTNCKGTSQYCKQLTILPIVQKPEAIFTANMLKGFTTDNFKLYDQSRNGVESWNWTITPSADASFVQGTTSTSQNPVVKLSKPGYYTISLTAGNSEGNSTLVRTDYIQVLRYEEPNTEYPIATGSDIGISRVRFANVDTSTALKSPIYDKIYEKKTAVLYRGVNYDLLVSRTTSGNINNTNGLTPMERKVWFDKNLDGLFNGPGEELLNEHMGLVLTTNTPLMIPNDIEPGRFTRLRIGISEGNTTLTPDKATSGCFEDYGVEIGLDATPPGISLIGSNLYRVEVHKPFIDPGVSAIDNLEGQIGYRAEVISNLDTGKAGIYTIKYTVKDLYGNVSDTAFRTVQMEINRTGPVITLIGPDTQYVEVYESYTDSGAIAKDNTGNSLDSKLQISGSVDTSTLGTYYITYEVTDQFSYTATRKRVVIVRDTKAPLISTTYGGPVIRHQITTPYTDANIILIDNYYSREELIISRTGTINTNKGGTYYLRYNVCDPSLNCTGDYFVQVEVEDTIPPLAKLLGDNPLTIDVFEPYTDPGVIATDNYYSQASLIVIKTNNIQIGKLGEYTINYTVRDGAGNETKLNRYVEVADRKKPEIEILNNPFELVRFKDYEEPGIKIHDNYYSHEQLIDSVMISTNLGVRNDTLWGELPGWKYIRYQVRDLSGNLSEIYERQVKVVEITGLNTHALSRNVSIYPNPNNGKFTLGVTEELKGKATLALYNTLGAKVYSQELDATTDTHTITTSGLAAGVYLIEVKTAGQQLLQRVIIK
jgi:PKD repeat protein